MNHVTGCTCADEGRCPTCRATTPSEPTTEEAFARIRTALQEHGFVSAALRNAPGHQSATTGLTALALLERRMQDNPQLAVLVEAFCSEVEAAQASRDARANGGQHVPAHGGLAHLPASAATSLGRWARDFREAMKK